MTKRIWQLISAAVAWAAFFPLPAAAEVQGAAKCANASWSALAAGECGIGDLHVLQGPANSKEDDPTALMVVAPDGIPEPETYALMLVGLVAVAAAARRRRHS